MSPAFGSKLGDVGVVAIGRNEGERLRRCFESIPQVATVVYVDSGSTDGSAELARARGHEVVDLDVSIPFTAARARNAGIARLTAVSPSTEFVLVIDGDCELAAEFLEAARAAMETYPQAAVVCGRRRERNRQGSIYNRLCDMEWDTPIGVVEACGGDALVRLAAFRDVGGYDDGIIAGEEPELCFRLRRQGWSIHRIDHEMTLHDAAMTRFDQWWKRSVRAGHAYAEGFARHGYWGHEVRSALAYGGAVPLVAVSTSWVTGGLGLGAFAAHGLLYARVRSHRLAQGDSRDDASLYAKFCVLSKFAHIAGMAKYVQSRVSGERTRIIEYKEAAEPVANGQTHSVAR